jgi:hypothetical protein
MVLETSLRSYNWSLAISLSAYGKLAICKA